MTHDDDRISDELYEEMDLWFGAVTRAFHDEIDPTVPTNTPFTQAEAFYHLWLHDLKLGMGVSCIMPGCEYCAARQEAQPA